MHEFDWSILEKLPLTWEKFKSYFSINKYDIHLNKFWYMNDYHEPQSISFEDTSELLDQINILISDEATFDSDLKKRYRNVITSSDSVIVTPYFEDRDELHIFTTGLALSEMEKQLVNNAIRGSIIT